MRLFAAVVPPSPAVDHLELAVQPVRAAHGELQWVPSDRWHLTLAFYGEVADSGVARLQRRIARAAQRSTALDLRFVAAGHFGGRVLWVGVGGQRDDLRLLARGVGTDVRPYHPHLTVARARRDADARPAATMLQAYDGPGWRATEIVLVRSHLGPEPRHEPLDGWPLGAA